MVIEIRPYTASVRCQKDIESLSKIGLSPEDISRSLDLSISFVKSHMERSIDIGMSISMLAQVLIPLLREHLGELRLH